MNKLPEGCKHRLDPIRKIKPWMDLGEALWHAHGANGSGHGWAGDPTGGDFRTEKDAALNAVGVRLAALKQFLLEDEDPSFVRGLNWKPDGEDTLLRLVSLVSWLRMTGEACHMNRVVNILTSSFEGQAAESVLRIRLCADRSRRVTVREGEVFLEQTMAQHLGDSNKCLVDVLRGLVRAVPPSPASAPASPAAQKQAGVAPRPPAEANLPEFIEGMLCMKPAMLEKEIVARGFVAQHSARRALAMVAYRHVMRLKSIFIEGQAAKVSPKADRLIMVGPSGCGKTHLLELVFGDILNLPVVIWDSTTLSEYPYVGAKVENVLTTLINKAEGNQERAQLGVICLDEIDKIATAAGSSMSFSSARDPAGTGAQRSLLKLLEGTKLQTPKSGREMQTFEFDCTNTFIAGAGAFTSLHLNKAADRGIGFGAVKGAPPPQARRAITAEDLIRYGFETEFIGRFNRILRLDPLAKDDLRTILSNNVIPRIESDLETYGLSLAVEPAVLDHLTTLAMDRGTAARGLHSSLAETMQECLFEALSAEGVSGVRLVLNGEGVGYELEPAPRARPPRKRAIREVA